MSATSDGPTRDADDERDDDVVGAGVWLPTPTVPFPRPAPPQPENAWPFDGMGLGRVPDGPAPVGPVPASWGRRAAGHVVDLAVMLVPLLLALAYETALMTVLGLVWCTGWYVGNVLADGREGQSLGKQLVGVRLERVGTERTPGVRRALLRDLAHVLDLVSLVGFLRPLWHRQTIADVLTGTTAVRAR